MVPLILGNYQLEPVATAAGAQGRSRRVPESFAPKWSGRRFQKVNIGFQRVHGPGVWDEVLMLGI